MAKAAAKRTASQNDVTIRNLKMGMLISTVIAILFRLLFRRSSLTSKLSVFIYAVTYAPTYFLSRYLENIGTPKRDSTTGVLVNSGEDLNQQGLLEYGFDVIYVTWACQIGSGVFGDKFWWLYAVIPLFAVFKVYSSFIAPFLKARNGAAPAGADGEEVQEVQSTSKRQEKLKKRQERGDPRIQSRTVKRAA